MGNELLDSPAVAFSTSRFDIDGTVLLHDVDVSFEDSGLHVIRGVNGSGKSTLLHALAGLIPRYLPQVSWWGQPLSELTIRDRAQRRFILFQDSVATVPWTVQEYVALASRTPADAIKQNRVDDALATLSMQEKSNQFVSTLSGGEWARVQLAQAVASDAKLLLCDEPDASLDESGRITLMNLLVALPHITRIVISHDASRFESSADSVTTISNGLVTQVR